MIVQQFRTDFVDKIRDFVSSEEVLLLKQSLLSPTRISLAVLWKNRVIGVLCAIIRNRKGEILFVRIRQEHYGQGAAALLLEETRKIMAKRGVRLMTLKSLRG